MLFLLFALALLPCAIILLLARSLVVHCHDSPRRDCLYESSPARSRTQGGAPRRSGIYAVSVLAQFRVLHGSSTLLRLHGRAALAGFIPRSGSIYEWGQVVSAVAVDIPFQFLIDHAPYTFLVKLAKWHGVRIDARSRAIDSVVRLLQSHRCNHDCAPCLSLLSFITARGQPRTSSNLPFVCDSAYLQQFMVVSGPLQHQDGSQYKYVGSAIEADVLPCARRVLVRVALQDLLMNLPYPDLLALAQLHYPCPRDKVWSVPDVIESITSHDCGNLPCARAVSVFEYCPVVRDSARAGPVETAPVRPSALPEFLVSSSTFPPPPVSPPVVHNIVSDWCKSMMPDQIQELPCAVCARLTVSANVTRVSMDSLNLYLLDRPAELVSRQQRRSDADSVAPIEGPVLYHDATRYVDGILWGDVCAPCFNALKRHDLPRHALANGLWIGDVPPELANLSFAERLMVARIRHNSFVVAVTMGQRKMKANAVAFSQPVAKVYSVLPPPREEFDHCLAILFTGPTMPVEADFKRTPLLVRHDAVLAALNWLLLNNSDYAHIEISLEHLAAYPQNQPPVTVMHRLSDGTTAAEAMSVDEADDERGTASGPCPFVVHGLSGADLANMNSTVRIATALSYFKRGGGALGIGQNDTPETIFHNPALFPGMFPWLYPYGLGGFENTLISTRLDRIAHVRHLLLFGDRRFQKDEYFVFIAFNQRQIRDSAKGGYLLTKRQHFDSVADQILATDPCVLQTLIDRAPDVKYLRPETDDEAKCFELISIIDHVASHVDGSAARRKQLRNELRSLIIAQNVPVFFVTFSPVDINHPLCLYYCGESIDILGNTSPYPSYKTRLGMIASNPVACARFFHFMVQAFIRIILRCGSDENGIFGKTSAYYGTVESQGRLTLHMHMLIWIMQSLSPQTVRDRVLGDPEFRNSLISWLESCVHGDYSTGSQASVGSGLAARGIYPEDDDSAIRTNPMTLCNPPPAIGDEVQLQAWYETFLKDSDEVVFLSNQHRCRRQDNKRKGCLRDGESGCRARFPRELWPDTVVDADSGAIRLKKNEAWINTFNPTISALLRCNTDVTSLLSGTQIKAIVAYITDYVTKSPLTTHSMFETVRTILDANSEAIAGPVDREDVARRLITKIVNSLSAKMEIGGPMAAAYLLGNPDHYTNIEFKTFYWSPYVRYVGSTSPSSIDRDEFGATRSDQMPRTENTEDESIVIGKSGSEVVPVSKVNDYIYRPTEYDRFSLYEYLRCTDTIKKKAEKNKVHGDSDDDRGDSDAENFNDSASPSSRPKSSTSFELRDGHPQRSSHVVVRRKSGHLYTLNFLGEPLPRPDKGDRETYCKTMLVFFAPRGWRSGTDLKQSDSTWEQTFNHTQFAADHRRVMANMNVLYECRDARDDFAAQRAADSKASLGLNFLSNNDISALNTDHMDEQGALDSTQREILDLLLNPLTSEGQRSARHRAEMDNMRTLLSSLQLDKAPSQGDPSRSSAYPDDGRSTLLDRTAVRTPAAWKDLVAVAKQQVIALRAGAKNHAVDSSALDASVVRSKNRQPFHGAINEVSVVTIDKFPSAFAPPQRIPRGVGDAMVGLITEVLQMYTLNTEQEHAFRMAARHLHHHDEHPLRMYLGGMGGTGKSRVIGSIWSFLLGREEEYRLLLVAPTGSAACQICGSTYHSVLGFGHQSDHGGYISPSSLSKVVKRVILHLSS